MEMLIARIVFSVAGAVLVAVPLYFIGHSVYKDGAWGRLGLAGISATAGLSWIEVVIGEADYWTLLLFFSLFMVATAIFISWHLIRFHRRIANPSCDPLPKAGDPPKRGMMRIAR